MNAATAVADKHRVLFFAEAVTLAHVARPIALARSLDRLRFDCTIACEPRYRHFVEAEGLAWVALHSLASSEFVKRLARGKPVYDLATLRAYLRQELQLTEALRPTLVVGDFRLSLCVSARLANVPYATVTNAYWSPYASDRRMPLPVLPMTKVLPISAARAIFRLAEPFAIPAHCSPVNDLRMENGLPTLGNDLRRVYTEADHVLYADIRSLFDTRGAPGNHHFIEPIDWSPPVAAPAWWASLPGHRPLVYFTLGSSGNAAVMNRALEALAALPVTVVVATAGAAVSVPPSDNVHIATYLDGAEATRRCALVVCNGGSLTSQQAIRAGVPVLGIAGNMDQFMNMAGLVRSGAAITIRADRASSRSIRAAVSSMLTNRSMQAAARRLGQECNAQSALQAFPRFASAVCGARAP